MKIREVMRPGAFTISENDSLGVAQAAMARGHIRHLPVMAGGRVVGMLSERDILAARARATEGERGWWAITAHDAMTTPVHTANPDDSLTEVAGRMAGSKVGAMPVVEQGKLLGIATISDVLDAEVRIAMGPSAATTLTASDVMTPWPATTGPDAVISDAIAKMVSHRIRHLPVLEHGTVVGMLSERDIRTAIGEPTHYLSSRYNLETPEYRVRELMTAPAVVVPFDLPLTELAKKFADAKLGAIPVIDRFGALLGIVSYVDALRLLA